MYQCNFCGNTFEYHKNHACPHCGSVDWVPAVVCKWCEAVVPVDEAVCTNIVKNEYICDRCFAIDERS